MNLKLFEEYPISAFQRAYIKYKVLLFLGSCYLAKNIEWPEVGYCV